jgi:hypothetical protein
MDAEVARFWQEFEEETGERVEAKAVAEIYEGASDQGVWFLLVLTDRSLWFKQVPSDNWISSLFRPRVLSNAARKAEDATLKIPRENLRSLIESGKKVRRWFPKPGSHRVTLTWQEGETLHSRRLSLDASTDMLPRLRSLCRERQA